MIVLLLVCYGALASSAVLALLWWGWLTACTIVGVNFLVCWLFGKWMNAGAVYTNEGSWVGLAYPAISGAITLIIILGIRLIQ